MKKIRETNEFVDLIDDGYHVVTHPEEAENGIAYAFNLKQVEAIINKLLKYFDRQSIVISLDDNVYSITLCDRIKPIASHIIQKSKLLSQFGLNNTQNKLLLCNATSAYQLD